MKQHSFFLKLLAGNLLIIALIVALGGAITYSLLNQRYQDDLYANQSRLARSYQGFVERIWPGTPNEMDRICKTLGEEESLRLTIMGADGTVLGDTQGDIHRMENHRTPGRPEVLAALEGRTGLDVRHSETLGTDFRYLALPVKKDGKIVGIVRMAVRAGAIVEIQLFLRHALAWAALAAMLVATLLALLISWTWYAPLKRIAATARQLAMGDLSLRAQVGGPAELSQLGTALNEMRDSLKGQIDCIANQRENLDSVIANLREGVIAVDAAGRVSLMNRSALTLLAPQCANPVGLYLQTAVRNTDVLEAYQRAQGGEPHVSRQTEMDLGGQLRNLEIHAVKVTSTGPQALSVLLVVHDVTEHLRMAAIKTEFVANASHELRTPLATIRAAVETLSETGPEDRESFDKLVAMMARHVDRLENMTKDLLNLSTVENSRIRPKPQEVALSSLTDWASSYFSAQAGEKDVALTIADAEGTVCSDRRLLELIIQNLIDNAIKFTPAGGRVECFLQNVGGILRIRVSDTGCGISPQDQPRVFERFFQADSSRSGDSRLRGTGLGLAIVKHAAERLGATVQLESQLGKGTVVTVQVPPAEEKPTQA